MNGRRVVGQNVRDMRTGGCFSCFVHLCIPRTLKSHWHIQAPNEYWWNKYVSKQINRSSIVYPRS